MKKILVMMVLSMMVVGNMAVAGPECKTDQSDRNTQLKAKSVGDSGEKPTNPDTAEQ